MSAELMAADLAKALERLANAYVYGEQPANIPKEQRAARELAAFNAGRVLGEYWRFKSGRCLNEV